jgi:hypothetical protein
VPGGPDYDRKAAIFGPPIFPTGDPDQDLRPAWPSFKTLVPLHSGKVLFPMEAAWTTIMVHLRLDRTLPDCC